MQMQKCTTKKQSKVLCRLFCEFRSATCSCKLFCTYRVVVVPISSVMNIQWLDNYYILMKPLGQVKCIGIIQIHSNLL